MGRVRLGPAAAGTEGAEGLALLVLFCCYEEPEDRYPAVMNDMRTPGH